MRWLPGLYMFILDHEGSWVSFWPRWRHLWWSNLGAYLSFTCFDVWFVPQTNCEGYTSLPVTALRSSCFGVWFVLQTICEGCNSLPVTTFWSFYIKRK